VELGVVGLPDIVNVEDPTPILVHDVEGLLGEGLSEGVHLPADTSKELIVVDSAAAIAIKDAEESLRVFVTQVHSEIVHSLLELVHVEVFGLVVISDLELLAKTSDTTGASGS
jgi:hypothetical protein